jgi:hypothetical protein
VPAQTLAAVDDQTLGEIFDPEGGGLLAAVLANPDASPTDGVNALAIEATSVESGSIFVESPLETSSFSEPVASQDFAAEGSGEVPESPLLEQRWPDTNIEQPPLPLTGQAHFIGDFTFSDTPIQNRIHFDLDLATGVISNAGFDIEYIDYMGTNPQLWGYGGSGQVDPSSWSFSISGFSQSGFDDNCPTCAVGNLGSNTSVSGTFGGPMNFGQTGSGVLSPDYVPTNGYPVSNLLSSYNFNGNLNHRSMVKVTGEFYVTAGLPLVLVMHKKFDLSLDLNTGIIKTGEINIHYIKAPLDIYDYKFAGGSGFVSEDTFHVNFTSGRYQPPSVPPITLTDATLDGHFDSSSPEIGTRVLSGPGNQLSFVYGSTPPANSLATTLPISEGQVVDPASDPYS